MFLKVIMSQDFRQFFTKKKLNLGPYEQANNFPEILRFREDIRLQSLQFARPRSQPLRKFSLL